MSQDPVYTSENEHYVLNVYQDVDVDNGPREWDNIGTMACFHDRYVLGDNECRNNHYRGLSPREFLMDLIAGDRFIGGYLEEQTFDMSYAEEMQWLMDRAMRRFIMMPLYLMDHSGLSMSTSSFNDSWDSGQVGWIFANLDDVRANIGPSHETMFIAEIVERGESWLREEVEYYDQFIRGNIFYYTLEKKSVCGECGAVELEMEESCGGFYGTDMQKNGISDALGSEYADLIENLA